MTKDELCQTDATGIRDLYRSGEVSPVEVVDAFYERMDKYDSSLNAFVYRAHESARREARQAERDFQEDQPVPLLHGIPFSVKDNIMTAGIRSTSGSPLFRNHVPEEDSGVVAAMKKAGAIVIGKTNTPAFGWKGTTDNLLFGPTRNPIDSTLTSGGSSGGAAVAAATAMAPINIGTDGGGSLRLPAAFTGTVGFKPSHGRIADVPPHTHWLLQHYGPISRTVRDIVLILQAVAGPDPRDPHSLPSLPADFARLADEALQKRRVLFTTQLGFVDAIDPEVAAIAKAAADSFEDLGWDVIERDLDWPDPAPFASVLSAIGLQARLRGFKDRVDDIDPGILQILDTAERLHSNAFYDAYDQRNRWCSHSLTLFQSIDLLVTPTCAVVPFPIGRSFPESVGSKPGSPSNWSPYLRSFNITGQPAISVPAGRTKAGLPVGIQIVGPKFGDASVLAAAAAFEKLRPWPTVWKPN